MDKNDFDIDFDFEKEYGFDPKDFLSSEDDFNYSEFDLSDLGDLEAENAQAPDGSETQEFVFDLGEAPAEYQDFDLDAIDNPEEAEDLVSDIPVREAQPEQEESQAAEDEQPAEEEPEEEGVPAKTGRFKMNFKLPKLPGKKPAAQDVPQTEEEEEEVSKPPKKKTVFSKLLDMYMEPVTRQSPDLDVMDPLDPRYVRRKKREKARIFKEVYLPVIIAGFALMLILSFMIGAGVNFAKVRATATQQNVQKQENTANQAAVNETQFRRVMAEAEMKAVSYDYDGAIETLKTFTADGKYREQIDSKIAELSREKESLKEFKNTSEIPNLSFHVLMVDPSRACNKDVSGADLAGLYNKNFVTIEEFSRILNQLYSNNYVLIDFNSFVSTRTGVDGNSSFFADNLMLPEGKKPVMITETMVNYFEYMVDPDKDGTPDAKGHGFASKLVVDGNGEIKAEYVDASGAKNVGNYDLVPILESFIQEHPDFSYRGARAILAVTGTEGVFGYRTNSSYVASRGQSYYDNEVTDAKKVVKALRDKGYTLASYTYSNQNYRTMTTAQISAEVQNWNNQITPVLGQVDTIVFARSGDIEAYSGTTFNVLYGSGLRFFLNSGNSPRVDINTTFVRQTRLMVTGEAMAWYSSQFSKYFDCNVVMDLTGRGGTPAKS